MAPGCLCAECATRAKCTEDDHQQIISQVSTSSAFWTSAHVLTEWTHKLESKELNLFLETWSQQQSIEYITLQYIVINPPRSCIWVQISVWKVWFKTSFQCISWQLLMLHMPLCYVYVYKKIYMCSEAESLVCLCLMYLNFNWNPGYLSSWSHQQTKSKFNRI